MNYKNLTLALSCWERGAEFQFPLGEGLEMRANHGLIQQQRK
jgi:hypothetical protein